MSPDESVLAALTEALATEHLDAVLVGATAAVLQGAPVMTRDFDSLPGGLSFASLKSRCVRFHFGAHELHVASLADVIASKEAADRPKDRAVLPILHEVLRVRKAMDAGER